MKTKELREIEEGVELISTGLLLIDQNREALNALAGSNIVDITARLNAQQNSLMKYLDPLKAAIKSYAITGNTGCVVGGSYVANVKPIRKNVVDLEAVKKFLGKRLSLFIKTRDEVHVTFDVKS